MGLTFPVRLSLKGSFQMNYKCRSLDFFGSSLFNWSLFHSCCSTLCESRSAFCLFLVSSYSFFISSLLRPCLCCDRSPSLGVRTMFRVSQVFDPLLIFPIINFSLIGDGVAPPSHLIRCQHTRASYEQNPSTKRESVVVPFHGTFG